MGRKGKTNVYESGKAEDGWSSSVAEKRNGAILNAYLAVKRVTETCKIGDLVAVLCGKQYPGGSKIDVESQKFKGYFIGEYPRYFRILVHGKGGDYVRCVNKNDLIAGDLRIKKLCRKPFLIPVVE